VYDILNCGPRQRFVVRGAEGPFIVHNCTQAVCADLLIDLLSWLDENDVPVIMHVHDEVVAEVSLTKAYKASKPAQVALRELLEDMCFTPEWADGLPLEATGWINPYFIKD